MKNQVSSFVVGVAVIALGAVVWILMPSFQSPDRSLNTRLDQTGERARRILDAYEGSQDLILTEVSQLGSGSGVDEASITNLVENNSKVAESALGQESERLDAMWRPAKSRRNQIDQRYNELNPNESAPRPPSSGFAASADGMARDMVEGVRQREKLIAENEARLAAAEAELRKALSESEGEASGTDHLFANRLAGITHYQQASAARRKADMLRLSANRALQSLSASTVRLEAVATRTRLVESSGIDGAIAAQENSVAEAKRKLDEFDGQIGELNGKIASISHEIDTQNTLAEAARSKMEAMEDAGLDYRDASAAKRFRQEYEIYAAQYRDTVRRSQALQFGTLDNARLEDSGDYIDGAFIPESSTGEIEYIRGLEEYQGELKAVTAARESVASWHKEAEEGLARLRTLRSEYATSAGNAASDLEKLRATASDSLDRYVAVGEELAAAEDDAINKFDKAARSFRKTQQVADRRVTDVPAEPAGPARETLPVSLIENDRWLGAQATCQQADANVAAALVLYDRYQHTSHAIEVISAAASTGAVAGWDAAAARDAVNDAKERGVALLEDAIDSYGKAHRNLDRHWTVVASFAGANYMLSLFDRPEALEVALQNYRNAVKDREGEPFVRPYLDRLQQLRNR